MKAKCTLSISTSTAQHRAFAPVSIGLLMSLSMLLNVSSVQAQTNTAFTYQGRLDQAAGPYTGSADFRVQLYRNNSAVGLPLSLSDVNVLAGLFVLPLNFGADVTGFTSLFGGELSFDSSRIEISVRVPGGSGGNFTTLAPRQALTPTPIAISLVNFARENTSVIDVSQFTDTTTFQINANVVQSLLISRPGELDSIQLKLVNTAASAQNMTLTFRGNNTIFGTSTASVPVGTNFVTFNFPRGINLFNTQSFNLDINTTTTLGVRYSTANPYPDGAANFLSTADLYFSVRLRQDGNFASALPLTINSGSKMPLLIATSSQEAMRLRGSNTSGAFMSLESTAVGGNSWLLVSNSLLNPADGTAGNFRIRRSTASTSAGLTISPTGQVGINKTSPLATFHVGGDIQLDGQLIIPATSRQYSIAGLAFTNLRATTDLTAVFGGVTGTNSGSIAELIAPVILPDNAQITSMRMHFIDNSNANSIEASLEAAPKTIVERIRFVAITSSGANAAVRTLVGTLSGSHVVDTNNNYYYVRTIFTTPTVTTDIVFRGVTIFYTIDSPLP